VSDLIARQQNLKDEPITSMQGIQDIDRTIQNAISENAANPNYTRQMRGILQDFRARADAVAPELAVARDGYAAQKRMEAVQNILDTTEDSPNRAQRIATKVQNFANDPKNVAGWTDEEIDTLRRAGQSGMVQDWLRTNASRLIPIIANSQIPGSGFLQFGSSYAARQALDNIRVARLQAAMEQLGQRVPQPGAVDMPTQPAAPPSLLSAARYAPLVGLLGQTSDQPRQ
jgi:hypothetical protein